MEGAREQFYDILLEAIKGIHFNEAGWQAVWQEFWGEERLVRRKKEEGSHRKKTAEKEVNIGGLCDDDTMVAMDDDEGDDSDLETFQVTKIGVV